MILFKRYYKNIKTIKCNKYTHKKKNKKQS